MLNRLQDVFASFQGHKVKYVIIGGIAAVLHATFYLDILVEATLENAQRLLDALLEQKLNRTQIKTDLQDFLKNNLRYICVNQRPMLYNFLYLNIS